MQKTSQMVRLIAFLVLMAGSVTIQGMHDNGLHHANMSAQNFPTDCSPGFYPCGSTCCPAPGPDPPTCCSSYCCPPGFS